MYSFSAKLAVTILQGIVLFLFEVEYSLVAQVIDEYNQRNVHEFVKALAELMHANR
ncbi:MAG: hypothetical protein WC874_02650 [Candidatus Izemoplasmatales bacterium]